MEIKIQTADLQILEKERKKWMPRSLNHLVKLNREIILGSCLFCIAREGVEKIENQLAS